MDRQNKATLVEELGRDFRKAKAAYLTSFTGIKVMAIDDLRKRVHQSGGTFRVIKNTLARLGTKGTQFEEIAKALKGPIGWAYTERDPVQLAKALKKFREENEVFSYQGGILEGTVIDAKGVDTLSDMPAKEVLLAQLLGVINGPARSLASVVQAVPRSVVNIIEAIRKKKEEDPKNG